MKTYLVSAICITLLGCGSTAPVVSATAPSTDGGNPPAPPPSPTPPNCDNGNCPPLIGNGGSGPVCDGTHPCNDPNGHSTDSGVDSGAGVDSGSDACGPCPIEDAGTDTASPFCPPNQALCLGLCCPVGDVCLNDVCRLQVSPHDAGLGCDADIQTDPSNCGQCGNACPADEVCCVGSCSTTCPPVPDAGDGSVCQNACGEPPLLTCCGEDEKCDLVSLKCVPVDSGSAGDAGVCQNACGEPGNQTCCTDTQLCNLVLQECVPSGNSGVGICTLGYWENHPGSWGVLPVVMGSTSYTESQCLTLLSTPTTGDESLQLSKQFVSAVENGGWANPAISSVMTQAQEWFLRNQGNPPRPLPWGIMCVNSGDPGCTALSLEGQLDVWNNSGTCK